MSALRLCLLCLLWRLVSVDGILLTRAVPVLTWR